MGKKTETTSTAVSDGVTPIPAPLHYHQAHAHKTKDHVYTPREKGDESYCTTCGFDKALHELGKTLDDGQVYPAAQ